MQQDFGTFLLPPDANEPRILQELIVDARFQQGAPRVHRISTTTLPWKGVPIRGYRTLTVDLRQHQLVIEEEWGGIVTARRIQPLPLGGTGGPG